MNIIYDIEQLSEASKPVEFITAEGIDKTELNDIVGKLTETMDANPKIIALAAPQIGIKSRVFCLRFDNAIKVFINPIIKRKQGQTVLPETCLNIPGKEYIIARPAEVTAVYYNEEFKYEDNKFLYPASALFAQMVDVLDGRLPNTDFLGLESDIEEDGSWQDATEDELKEVQEYYLNTYVPALKTAYDKQINQDEETKKQYKLEKLTEDVINDRVQIIDQEATKAAAAQARMVNQYKNKVRQQEFKTFAGKKCKR